MDSHRLLVEFDVSEFALARWISAAEKKTLDGFAEANRSGIAEDLDRDLVYLARSQFYLDYTQERAPGIMFTDVKAAKTDRWANCNQVEPTHCLDVAELRINIIVMRAA
jgi:hypothetical protein